MISVVIPTLNAERNLTATLDSLQEGRAGGLIGEIIVVDGGSTDGGPELAERMGCRVFGSARGRGLQLRAGCDAAEGTWLLCLHADTRLGLGWSAAAMAHVERRPDAAAYFGLAFDDPSQTARAWEAGVSLRCRLLALPYGDQGLLMPRALYEAVGGYDPVPLLEDVAIVRRIGRSRLFPLAAQALTSAERFRREGWVRRTAANWAILARFLAGEGPDSLAKRYSAPSVSGRERS